MGQNITAGSVSRIPQRSPWDRIQQWCLFLIFLRGLHEISFLRGLHGTEYKNDVCFSYSSEVSMGQNTMMVSVSRILRGLHGTEYNTGVYFSYSSYVFMGQNTTTGLFLIFLRGTMGQNTTTGSVSCISQRSPWDRIQQWGLFLVFSGLHGTEYNIWVCFSYSAGVSMGQNTTMGSVSCI